MRNILLKNRRWLGEVVHGAILALALPIAFLLRFDFTLEPPYPRMLLAALPLALGIKLAVFRAFGLRDLAWRYVGFPDLTRLAVANLAASVAAALVLRPVMGSGFPRSIHALDFLVALSAMVGARAAARLWFDRRHSSAGRRVLIFGAGKAGVTVLTEIRAHPEMGYRIAGLLDDDPRKRNLRMHGVSVLGGRAELAALAERWRIEEVLIALPSASGHQIARILECCHAAHVPAKRVPALAELMVHRELAAQIREIRLEDLLGRAPVLLDENRLRRRLEGRVALVTGAGGSIGSELCRQIARFGPRAIVGLDHSETALYQIDQEMREYFPAVTFYPEIGNIQNRRRLEEILDGRRPHAVFHAAAYKHVPMMEAHLFEAVENNVFGTENLARAAMGAGVEDFVLVSSDKAVRPVNVMGATKRLAELVCLAAGQSASSRKSPTCFAAVRFGNVLGSSGSVIPRFRRQIAAGGPVTVTHPQMRRFFMSIPEAAQLVLEAGAMGRGGEVFVLEMGEPVRIVDLARQMILLAGLRPGEDIAIEFSGVRPGEKLCEELSVSEEDTLATGHSQIRIFTGRSSPCEELDRGLDQLRRATEARDGAGVVLALKEMVPEYNPSGYVLRQALAIAALATGR